MARDIRRPCFHGAWLLLALALPLAASPPMAAPAPAPLQLLPGEYLWLPELAPKGPLLVLVSLPEQRAYVYRNGVRIGVATVSTGKKGYETPTGVFTILQKKREHYSNLYDNAPMPFMHRLTWDGLEPGVNDAARDRMIVMHGAGYVDPITAASQGRLGRSYCCPAVRREVGGAGDRHAQAGPAAVRLLPRRRLAAALAFPWLRARRPGRRRRHGPQGLTGRRGAAPPMAQNR